MRDRRSGLKALRAVLLSAVVLATMSCEDDPKTPETICRAYCTTSVRCEWDYMLDYCTYLCLADHEIAKAQSPECGSSYMAIKDCTSPLTCDQFDAFKVGDPWGPDYYECILVDQQFDLYCGWY